MKEYKKAQMEIIEFENEDVITDSGCNCNGGADGEDIDMS